jgi:nucleotide sugar dehydrogenase
MNTTTLKTQDNEKLAEKFDAQKNIIEKEENLNKNNEIFHDLKPRNKKVAVIGLGYVGLPLAVLIKEKKYGVVGIDEDLRKIDLIKKGVSPIEDKKLTEKIKQIKLEATSNPVFIKDAGIVVICVPTPVDSNNLPDFGPLEAASKTVGQNLKENTVVIVESTVNPGVCESTVLPILEKYSGLKAGTHFELSHCPERVNPGDQKWTLENINRVVGSLTPEGLRKTIDFYKQIIGKGKITAMNSIKEAEAVKIVENSFRDINIAFVNELAMSFSLLGIDVVNVIKGASTKPFSFLAHYPSCGVGGHCIPVDPYYLIEHAKQNGFEHKFLMTAREINHGMPKYTVKNLKEALVSKNIKTGTGKIVILGAAYKPNIDDMRESPALEIFNELKKEGYEPLLCDPHVTKAGIEKDIEKSLKEAVAVILATAHKEFVTLSPKYFLSKGINVLVDGQNCFDKEEFKKAGIEYRGIGRK